VLEYKTKVVFNLAGDPEETTLHERLRSRWEDNNKINFE
jgi:hypothetical protein